MSLLNSGSVSVITPVYNRTRLLQEAIESALAQTYRPIEIIIVDDGSTDADTIGLIQALRARYPDVVQTLRKPNRGPGPARHAGMEIARGEFVQFLDSDDLLLSDKLESQVGALSKGSSYDLSYGKTREYVVGTEPEDRPSRFTGERLDAIFPAALRGRLWATETPLFRRTALDRIGPWSDLRVLEDWEYECRLGTLDARLHYCDKYVSDHRHHPGDREGLRWRDDVDAYRDMLAAHIRVLGYARRAGVDESYPEMKEFARNLFRLARGAGARGLKCEARHLLALSGKLDADRRGEYRLYRWGAGLIGWKRIERLGEFLIQRKRHYSPEIAPFAGGDHGTA